jgi:hypothetical protein
MLARTAILTTAGILLWCCAGEPAAESPAEDAALTTDVTPEVEEPLTPASIVEQRAAMTATVAASMDLPEYFHDGTWHGHFGDGLMFGPSQDLAAYLLTNDKKHLDRAVVALDTNLVMVLEASANLLGAMANLESVAMALLGLLEAGQFVEEPLYSNAALELMNQVDAFAAGFDDYIVIDEGEFAADTYGPTSLSSFLALMHLEYALTHPGAEGDLHVTRAEEIIEHVHEKAWDPDMGAYLYAPDDDRLMLYPNATMMVAQARALQLTGNQMYAQRFADAYAGLQPLLDEDGDHYHSPYSAESMGATDDDYTTLSSQNYLMLGLWTAFVETGEMQYLEDIHLIMEWLEKYLLVDGVIVHHWMNGRPADETDPYDFCSGCNLQTLYIMYVIEHYAKTAE